MPEKAMRASQSPPFAVTLWAFLAGGGRHRGEDRNERSGQCATITTHAFGAILTERQNAMHERISIDPDVCDGQASIKGKRIPVHLIVKIGRLPYHHA